MRLRRTENRHKASCPSKTRWMVAGCSLKVLTTALIDFPSRTGSLASSASNCVAQAAAPEADASAARPKNGALATDGQSAPRRDEPAGRMMLNLHSAVIPVGLRGRRTDGVQRKKVPPSSSPSILRRNPEQAHFIWLAWT